MTKEQWNLIDYESHDIHSIGGWAEAVCECVWRSGQVYNSCDAQWGVLKERANKHLKDTGNRFAKEELEQKDKCCEYCGKALDEDDCCLDCDYDHCEHCGAVLDTDGIGIEDCCQWCKGD